VVISSKMHSMTFFVQFPIQNHLPFPQLHELHRDSLISEQLQLEIVQSLGKRKDQSRERMVVLELMEECLISVVVRLFLMMVVT
jgi:hypothetical protein